MVRNVLLITVDSLRADRARWSDTDTPVGAALADSGRTVSFSRAFATGPGTTPSFPALLTGTLPLSHGGLGPLTSERPRVASRLGRAGLATGGFHCNPFLSTHFNYDVGFETFQDYQNPLMGIATKLFPRGIELSNPRLRRLDDALHLTDGIKKAYQLVKGKPRPYVSAEVITDDTIAWLASTDAPFFCWTHYMDVHHPCYPPVEYRKAHGVGDVSQSDVATWYSSLLRRPEALSEQAVGNLERLYRASIEYTDAQIARIIEQLRRSGRYEDTLIVLTSDHGELFGDHGHYGKPERMYDELLHVPLVVANGPEYLDAATDHLVSLLDIPPLMHDALEQSVPGVYEGRVPGKDAPREHIMAEHEVDGEVIVGARSGSWLYEGDGIRDAHRLFEVRADGIVDADPARSAAGDVREAVQRRVADLDVDATYLQGAVDPGVEDRLEDLGYL